MIRQPFPKQLFASQLLCIWQKPTMLAVSKKNNQPSANNPGTEKGMTKSELIEQLAMRKPELSIKQVESAVKLLLDQITESLATGGRVEVRGFGSFSLHYREPRQGRNPKTGDSVELNGKYVPHFKPGKELRDQVNAAAKF